MHKFGKVLKGYYFFWFREKGKQKIYYQGDELGDISQQISQYYSGQLLLMGNMFDRGTIRYIQVAPDFEQTIPLLRHRLDIGFDMVERGAEYLKLDIYWNDTIYVFPTWLRTMMAGCITCTPTIYGNIIYWSVMLLARQTVLYNSLFFIFNDSLAGMLAVWIAYWLCLAWMNTVLWKIYNKN